MAAGEGECGHNVCSSNFLVARKKYLSNISSEGGNAQLHIISLMGANKL